MPLGREGSIYMSHLEAPFPALVLCCSPLFVYKRSAQPWYAGARVPLSLCRSFSLLAELEINLQSSLELPLIARLALEVYAAPFIWKLSSLRG